MRQSDRSTWIENTLATWRKTILAGNQAFSHGSWSQATHCYQSAYHYAQQLITPLLHTETAQQDYYLLEQYCPAYVVAAHNLAESHLRLQQPERAVAVLTDAHLTISCLAEHSDDKLQTLALQHLRKTYQQLLEFVRAYGTHPKIDELLHQQSSPSLVDQTLH